METQYKIEHVKSGPYVSQGLMCVHKKQHTGFKPFRWAMRNSSIFLYNSRPTNLAPPGIINNALNNKSMIVGGYLKGCSLTCSLDECGHLVAARWYNNCTHVLWQPSVKANTYIIYRYCTIHLR